MVAKEQQVGAHVAPGDGEDQGTASKDSAFKMPAMSNNGKSSPAPRSPAPCKQTGSSPIKKSKASASSSESDKKSSKKSASTDEIEEESDDDLFAPVSTGKKMPSKSAAPAADADATMKTPSKRVTPSSSAAKDKSSTKKAIPSAKKAIHSALKVRSASAKKGKTSKEEKDQEERNKVDDLRGTPMGVGNLEEMIDDNHAIVSSSTGPEYYVNVMSFVNQDLLEPGASVLLHNKVVYAQSIRQVNGGGARLVALCNVYAA